MRRNDGGVEIHLHGRCILKEKRCASGRLYMAGPRLPAVRIMRAVLITL